MTTYTSQYPTQDASHVKATTKYTGSDYYPYYTTDPTKSLTGPMEGNQWVSELSSVTNQRFHIDLGSAKIIRRIYYENSHASGAQTDSGANTVTFWGSNNAGSFTDLTYGTDTGWTQLTLSAATMDQHVAANQADPKYLTVDNTVEYRYYALKIADNQGFASFMGIRRLELQTEDGYTPTSVDNYSGVGIGSSNMIVVGC